MLELDDVHTYYGESHILQGVSLTIGTGAADSVGAADGAAGGEGGDGGAAGAAGAEIVALLGRNGAGKTTTLRSIVGLTPARRGRIVLDGTEITGTATHRIARAGVAFVASGRRVFGSLTVRQNLDLAAAAAIAGTRRPGVRQPGTRQPGARRSDYRRQDWSVNRVLEIFPKLEELAGRRAEFLSGGEQQMLKLSRALLTGSRVLLLDEPTEGLSPAVVGDLGHWLELLRTEGIHVLLTEQNALFALRHADRGYILEKGKIWLSDTSERLRESKEMQVHLGVGIG